MGIISDFLGGAAKGAADGARMQFNHNLQKEQREVDFLREEAFKTKAQESSQAFKAEDRKADQEFKATEGQKDRDSQMERTKYTADSKTAAKKPKPQLIKYTTNKGFEQQGVLHENGDGTYTIIKPGTDEVVEDRITKEELKNKAAQLNVAEGRDSDWIPFNEYGSGDERVRAAVADDRKGKTTKSKGIVNSQVKASDRTSESKMIGKRTMSKKEYMDRMLKKYPNKQKQIEKQWLEYSSGN